jgi:hypothetical protein
MEQLADSITANIRDAMLDKRKGLQDLPTRDLEALCDPKIAQLVSVRVHFSQGFASRLSDMAKTLVELRRAGVNLQISTADDFAVVVASVPRTLVPDDADSNIDE